MVLTLLLTIGCYSQADFADDQATANCDWFDRCDLLAVMTYDDLETCLAAEGPTDTGFTCPDFEASQAQDCVEAIEASDCSDLTEPAACEGVCAVPADSGTSNTE